MGIQHNEHNQDQTQSFLLDALYCEEERWEETIEDEILEKEATLPLPLPLLEQDLFWEDEELLSLFTKEKETISNFETIKTDPLLCLSRKEAVKWILKVNAHYGFSTFTAILAINYFDRFLSSLHFQKDKPWMIQLVAVTCLSLAAKVEETQVPLLLDFQVEDAKYVFEAKTIQRMELLVLSSLKWRMNPVTPLSFVDHIIRRLGLKSHIHWEFLKQCERILLLVIADCRFLSYMPSVLATATMLHVIHQVEPCNAADYQNQLLEVLNISKEKVNDCYELITEVSYNSISHKRKYESPINSPSAVIDTFYSSENSNESWDLQTSSSIPSTYSPRDQFLPLFKKSRVQEQQMRLTSLSRVFVDYAVGSPR
ncbi:cyclin-D3-1-like [Nicotiana tabacum]|uniref:Cyclin-D3-1-like n=1 Tax=Nicotiana tabacum TaxID=4097 RepID=Q9SXN7_TOBAC|nr:cyclin-D3-1-like [Nicotiana tabacum]BAA76478.1 NtcycD3-1 [Nicotiana tabacum]